jgi:hypothetical protein
MTPNPARCSAQAGELFLASAWQALAVKAFFTPVRAFTNISMNSSGGYVGQASNCFNRLADALDIACPGY